MTRFAIEVGFVIGAGALALVMCENTRHGLVGILAVGAALTYGVFRSVEFLGAERLTRPARFALVGSRAAVSASWRRRPRTPMRRAKRCRTPTTCAGTTPASWPVSPRGPSPRRVSHTTPKPL